MANPHAVLSLVDALDCCDPALYVIWGRFRQMRRFLAYRPNEVPRVDRLLDLAAAGRPGHGPVHLLLKSAAGPYQHFKAAIYAAWRGRAAGIFTARKGVRGAPLLDCEGTGQLLFSSNLRERVKILLRSILCGGTWNGILLGKSEEEDVPCRFCGGVDGDGHLFWDCPCPPFARFRGHTEFTSLMRCDRSAWPRYLAWHGWLLALSPRRVHLPWAASEVDCVDAALEGALGAYPLDPAGAWRPERDSEDIADLSDDMPANPNMWTDGSRDEDFDALVGVACAGAFVKSVPWVF